MLTGPSATGAVAAFNGGFRFQDARGGFYVFGREAVPLRGGAASIVIDGDGAVKVGVGVGTSAWTRTCRRCCRTSCSSSTAARCRPPRCHQDNRIWGATLGAKTIVARSGLGVTANGALVYVAGPALSARTLAESLQRAGVVRGMALDLNPEWVTLNFFEHSSTGVVTGRKLYPGHATTGDPLPRSHTRVARLLLGLDALRLDALTCDQRMLPVWPSE